MQGSVDLWCEFEEHTDDLEDNRILMWTLHRLRNLSFKNQTVADKIETAYRGLLGEITIEQKDAADCVDRIYNRLNEDYRSTHLLCKFFLDSIGPAFKKGDVGFVSYSRGIDPDNLAEPREDGLSVQINKPYVGTKVPTAFYRKDGRVASIMVEINRSLYMDETSGAKAPAFDSIKKQIRSLLCSIKQFQQQAQPGVSFTKTSHSAVIEKSRNNWDAKRWFAYVSSAIYFSDNLLANFSFVTKDATRIRPDSRSPM